MVNMGQRVGKTAQQTMTDAINGPTSGAVQKGLCDYLIESGKLSPANAERALRLQSGQDTREPIGAILVKLGDVTERNVAECLAIQLALPLVEAKNFPEELSASEQISHKFLQDSKTLILAEDDEHLTVVMADPLDTYVIHALSLLTGKQVLPQVGIASEIEHALEQSHARKNDADDSSKSGSDSAGFLGDVEHLKELASEAPIIKLVNLIINRAAE